MLEIYKLAGFENEAFHSVDSHFPGIGEIENAHRDFLTTTPRYERFMSGESIEEWVGLLGVDVLSLGHGYSTEDVATQFMDCNDQGGVKTSQTEKFVMRVASRIHDFGEIKDENGGVGDISHDKKSDADRKKEEVVFERLMRKHVYDPFEADFLKQIYRNVVHGNRSSDLARQFNAIERIGYLLTAHQAFKGVDGKRIANCNGLVGNVLSNQVVQLIDYAAEYPMVENVLRIIGWDISQMLDVTTLTPPIIDNEGTLSFDPQRLVVAQQAWVRYTAS